MGKVRISERTKKSQRLFSILGFLAFFGWLRCACCARCWMFDLEMPRALILCLYVICLHFRFMIEFFMKQYYFSTDMNNKRMRPERKGERYGHPEMVHKLSV